MSLNKRLSRQTGIREQRKLFIIVVEGETEQRYFENFRKLAANVKVSINRGKDSSPEAVLRKMEGKIEEYKKKLDLKRGDQAWLVFDRDQWDPSLIEKIWDWSAERNDRGVGFSSPQFEWWLLLHFESGLEFPRKRRSYVDLACIFLATPKGDKTNFHRMCKVIVKQLKMLNQKW